MKEYKMFNESEYHNFLDYIKLSYSDLLKQIKQMEYIQPKKFVLSKCTEEEYIVECTFDKQMPLFSKCMYLSILVLSRIPTEDEYKNFYFKINKDFFEEHNMTDEGFVKAIENRCNRAYPSLIRDIMFGKYLQEKLPKDYKIINNPDLDTKAEIDLMLVGKNNNWGIHLYTNTARSQLYRYQKNYRQKLDFTNVIHIDLPIDLNDCDTFNNLKLYGEKQYKQLLSICKEYNKK